MRTVAHEDVALGDWVAAVSAAKDQGYDTFDWLSAVDRMYVAPAAEPTPAPAADQSTGEDATGVDAPAHGSPLQGPGFDIVVHLIKVSGEPGPGHVEGRLLRTRVTDGQPAPSLTGVFAGAAWYERETFEMFGIDFAGYHDRVGAPIRPLLLPEGFEGNPLKKSFMLAARASKAWPGAKEPGEGHAAPGAGTGRRRVQAPGVPDPVTWGPRDPREVPAEEPGEGAAGIPSAAKPAEGEA